MEINDRISNCQSFGSKYHPSSQSRKISIGITVDSLAKKKLAATEEDEAAVSNAERINLYKENLAEINNRSEGAKTATKEKQTEAAEEVSYPWISTRSLNQNAKTSETVLCKKQTSRKRSSSGRQKKLSGLKDAQMTHSVQFFANETSILRSGDSNQKKFDGITFKRKGRKNGNSECAEEFTFVTTQEVLASDKTMTADKSDKMEKGGTESLRIKLWQILGTVSSPKSQCSNPQAGKLGADKLETEKVVDQIGDTVVRPRQNSDTIETDSGSPNQPTRRPLTRSLMRKRASTKVPKSNNIGPSSSSKQQHQKKNIFSFEEGWSTKWSKLDSAINFDSSMSTRKKIHLKSSSIEPRKICFSGKDNADEPPGASYGSELPTHAGKTSSFSNKMESFHCCIPEDRGDCVKSKNAVPGKDFYRSPEPKKMNQKSDFDNPALTENTDQPEDRDNPSSKNAVDSPDEIQSPTFAFKTPILSPSPCSTPRTVQMEQDVCSPALERMFNVGTIRTFRTSKSSNPDCSGSDAETVSPDDKEKLKDPPARIGLPVKEENDAENGLAELSSDIEEDDLAEWSSEDGDPGSSGKGSPIIKEYDCHKEISPETGNAEKPNFMHCPTKRLRSHGGISVDEFSPPLPSPKGDGESEWFQEPAEQNQKDDLTRAVTLFAFALDNFKRKMDSATRKKSSDILVSISEDIHLQLQNVESQIQTDVGKLTSLSKLKRKRLETRFEEQQEQLKLIHEKFKEDIHHHLQNCTKTLEVLEAHQIELKGTVKKQRTSHQKLLLQLEEAVETQLNDAQRRITTVNELARKKMAQLKHLIAECLKESILN